MSWRVKKSYSRYCRQPAMRSVRDGVQPVFSQKASMQRCVASCDSGVSSAADSETEQNTVGRASSAARCAATH